ncbi:MAG TPA: T9SS type A sorting domain-containing protein [Flavisolibacter sp.]|nr:T9SS type A sorting domain-containing protein [Flavisolibacter sp.]
MSSRCVYPNEQQPGYFLETISCKKKQLHAAFPAFSKYFLFMIFLMVTATGLAQKKPPPPPPTSPADCKLGCTSNDVQIVKAYLSDADGNKLGDDFVCPQSGSATVYLTLELTTNTPRVGVVIFGEIWAWDPVAEETTGTVPLRTMSECFGDTLNKPTNKVTFQNTFTWTCGTPIAFTKVFIGWGTGNTNFCTSDKFQCPATSSKCYQLPPDQAIGIETPSTDEASQEKCSTQPGGSTAVFDLKESESDVKGTQTNVTVRWYSDAAGTIELTDASDGTTDGKILFTNTSNPQNVYAKVCSNTSPYPCSALEAVTLTVYSSPSLTITNPDAVCSPSTVDITVAAVTAGSILPTGTTLKYYTDNNNAPSNTEITSTAAQTLGAGKYWIVASSNTTPNCSDAKAVTVTVNTSPDDAGVSVTPPTCANANGTVTVTSPLDDEDNDYQYSNDGGTTWQDEVDFTVAAGASYSITVQNKATDCVSLNATTGTMDEQPSTPDEADVSETQPTCANANGTVTVTAPLDGGGIDYEYRNNAGAWQDDVSFTVAANASYSITVRNKSSQCVSTATTGTMGAQPSTPENAEVSETEPTCANANGTVTVTSPLDGGGIDYEYRNNDGAWQEDVSFTVAADASYSITVRNKSSQCVSGATTGTLGAQPSTPDDAEVSETQPSCANANGTVTVTSPLDGGGIDYEYRNNDGAWQDDASFTVAANTSYSITVRNKSSQCVSGATTGTMGTQPSGPSTPSVCVVQPSLCGPATGKVKFTDLGAGYQYTINGSDWQDCPVFLDVAAGTATSLKVKNSLGCESPAADCSTICAGDPDEIVACEPSNDLNRMAEPRSLNVAEQELKIKAYPNPFSDRIRFVISVPEAGSGSLEVFNSLGQKVKTVYQGSFTKGAQNFELHLPARQASNLVYILRVGNQQVSGKILQLNR